MTKLIDLMPDAKDVYVGKGITVYDVKQRLRKLEAVREAGIALTYADAVTGAEAWQDFEKALADCGDET